MKIFLSWSGDRSKAVASAFRSFLPRVVQAFEPWLSSADLAKGTTWIEQINGNLRDSNGVGLFFATREAQTSKWLHFEAGAVAALGHRRVCVVRVGLDSADLLSPLSHFQSTGLAREDVQSLLRDLNALQDRPIADTDFTHFFNAAWPEADRAIQQALADTVDGDAVAQVAVPAMPGLEELVPTLQGIGERLGAIERQLLSTRARTGLFGFTKGAARGLVIPSDMRKPSGIAAVLEELVAEQAEARKLLAVAQAEPVEPPVAPESGADPT